MNFQGLPPQKRLSRLFVVLVLATCCFFLAWSVDLDEKSSQKRQANLRRSRKLQNGTPYNVVLFLAIKYLNDTVASQIETSEQKPSNDVAMHLCKSVNFQVKLT
jgi:hypothetical protein